MIKNIFIIIALIFFTVSCKNVKILDPNERNVEVQYFQNDKPHRYITQNVTSHMKFRLKDFANDFTNIWCVEWEFGNKYLRACDLYRKKDIFTIDFDRGDYNYIDYMQHSYYTINGFINSFRVTNVNVSGSQLTLYFDRQVNGKANIVMIDLGIDLDTLMSGIKNYSYLSDKENYNHKIVVLTMYIYGILQQSDIISKDF
ncbi:hypothetical protein [Brachyspira alvinipulli]|uniref:hypothetical protein n=1 Tax=Brachyspira alvinipulli TaxID=84379 RepID=UPI000486F561|nr:hypothetical protein [Brachyspira alvinipulli]